MDEFIRYVLYLLSDREEGASALNAGERSLHARFGIKLIHELIKKPVGDHVRPLCKAITYLDIPQTDLSGARALYSVLRHVLHFDEEGDDGEAEETEYAIPDKSARAYLSKAASELESIFGTQALAQITEEEEAQLAAEMEQVLDAASNSNNGAAAGTPAETAMERAHATFFDQHGKSQSRRKRRIGGCVHQQECPCPNGCNTYFSLHEE